MEQKNAASERDRTQLELLKAKVATLEQQLKVLNPSGGSPLSTTL